MTATGATAGEQPAAPWACWRQLRQLEATHGPVTTIVLATSSGLEHKLPLPSLARAFPRAQVWVSPGQWSFPVRLPLQWPRLQPQNCGIVLRRACERYRSLPLALCRIQRSAC